jgi:hypothetical protein
VFLALRRQNFVRPHQRSIQIAANVIHAELVNETCPRQCKPGLRMRPVEMKLILRRVWKNSNHFVTMPVDAPRHRLSSIVPS